MAWGSRTNLALRNKNLTVSELNESVQQTIDRLIFLRIAEDRGIEPYGTLQERAKGSAVYKRLIDLFRDADLRYNSGLFHFRAEAQVSGTPDTLTPELQVDDKVLRNIITSMYYPSPYEFSVFPADILGQVYEQFLGKVIRLTPGHEAKIDEKPEVKKAGGVFYTPTNIVDYIVGRTLGRVLEGKTPRAALNVRVLDPACGSGSFLIGAYDYLIRWFIDAYVAEGLKANARRLYQTPSGEYRLTLAERKRILTSCIYGVDIDRQAVEVTKLSLVLKVLEEESLETISAQIKLFDVARVLPDLNRNIQCGNSLVGTDVLDHLVLTPSEEDAINMFDWEVAFPEIMRSGGFHAIIGNPPYDVLEKDRGGASWPHALLREYLPFRQDYNAALGGKLNLFRIFLVQSINLARSGGEFGMIVPMSLIGDISTASTRAHVLSTIISPQFDCFPQKDNPARRVFKRAKLSTVVVTGPKSSKLLPGTNIVKTRVFPGNDLEERAIENTIAAADCSLIDATSCPIPMVDQEEWNLCKKIHSDHSVKRLGDLGDSYQVTRGEINQTTFGRYITGTPGGHVRLLKGVQVGAFETRTLISQGEREWLDEAKLLKDYPNRTMPPARRIATQRITGVDERQRLVCTIIEDPIWFADSTNSIAQRDSAPLDLEFLVALLNSDFMQWRFRLTSTNNNVGTNELLALPIRLVESGNPHDQEIYQKIRSAGEQLTSLKTNLAASKSSAGSDSLQRRISQGQERLNRLVEDFYGLTASDRDLIRTRLARKPIAAVMQPETEEPEAG